MPRAIVVAGALLLAGSSHAQGLKTEKLADGSGQIGVAAGWKVADSAKGAVTVTGPAGASMMLGVPVFVFSKTFDQQTLTPGVNPEVPRVSFDNPIKATLDVLAAFQRRGLVSGIKLKAALPATGFPGQAAFLRYSCVVQGKTIEVFGLYAIMPTDGMSGTFYFSAVQAPTAAFPKRLPEMMAMWKSWNLSPRLVQERLDSARKTIAEADFPGKLSEAQENQRRAALKGARDFQGYIRD